jgi:hypothetical protein
VYWNCTGCGDVGATEEDNPNGVMELTTPRKSKPRLEIIDGMGTLLLTFRFVALSVPRSRGHLELFKRPPRTDLIGRQNGLAISWRIDRRL